MPTIRTPFLLLLVLVASAQAQPGPEPAVRVRVLDRASLSQVEVEATGVPGLLLVDGIHQGTLEPGASITLSRAGADVRVSIDGSSVSGRVVRIEAAEIHLRAGRTDRRYPSRLDVRSADGHLELVNHAPMERYVASVVASEFGFPVVEGAKAQAVLARTYAARRAGSHATYDLDDHQGSQVYRGLGTLTAVSNRAAQETAGQTLTYHGALADAYYFSSSGGHTANNESLWQGAPVPYLRGVPDPYDTAAPDHSWRTTASRSAVLRALSSRFGGSVTDLRVEERSRNRRVLRVRLVGGRTEIITGSQLRQAVNAAVGSRTVRSTRYDLSTDGDQFVFTGGGFGHGVGMSQYGALGQAQAGRSYREILAHYFVGTDVSGSAPMLAGSPARSEPAAPVAAADIPREPVSALRTRYRPPSGRRWPTPRRLVQAEAPAEVSAAVPVAAAEAPPASAPRRARRTAW